VKSVRWAELLPPLLLAVFAWVYYAAYYRVGFLVADEGSVALLAQRLVAGERPFTDLVLGYNVLWFYPIAGLFQVFGVDFLVMKRFFFALAGATGLLAYAGVRGLTGSRVIAVVVALGVLVIPGSTYKTYIPLLVVSNLLLMAWMLQRGKRIGWLAAGGALLGLTFLIRIDFGVLLAAPWLLTAVALPWVRGGRGWRVWGGSLAGLTALGLAAVAIHVPVLGVASAQGWDAGFRDQYRTHWRMVTQPLARTLGKPFRASRKRTKARVKVIREPEAGGVSRREEPGTTLQRAPVRRIVEAKQLGHRIYALLTYAPWITGLGLAVGGGLAAVWQGWRRRDVGPWAAMSMAAAGCMTAFPQFYFFRPDVPHLAEFMPGFLVAAGLAVPWLFRAARSGSVGRVERVCAAGLCSLVALHAAVYLWWAPAVSSAGTIAERNQKLEFFRGENGVEVWVPPRERERNETVLALIHQHAPPGAPVVCYPYLPGFNVLSNRPTYERSLYVDDLTAGRGWPAEAIRRMEEHRPPVVIVSDWAVNRTEQSRFRNWAREVKAHLAGAYDLVDSPDGIEVWVRKPAPAPPPGPAAGT